MNNFRKSAIRAVLASVVMTGVNTTVFAEDPTIEEIMVTGSRIPQNPNLVSVSPITTVSADEFLNTGTIRVEDLLNDLPQTFASNASTDSNGATGTASVDLRGLGTNRTLVLLNGKRLVRGTPRSAGGVDLNSIPSFLVKEVEVLTGGASAAYGSDAIAGVVNFKMDTDFTGLRIDYQGSQYQHKNDNSTYQKIVTDKGFDLPSSSVSDGGTHAFALAIGGDFDDGKGHTVMYAQYRKVEAIYQADRDYSACALNKSNSSCGGSSTLPIGRFTDFGSISSSRNGKIIANAQAAAGGVTAYEELDEDAQDILKETAEAALNVNPQFASLVGKFDYVTKDNSNEFRDRDGDLYNYAPANFYQRPDKNVSLGAFSSYEISDKAEAYFEVSYSSNGTKSQIAPSGNFFVTEDLNCDNSLLSDSQFEQLCGQFGLTKDNNFSDLGTILDLDSNPDKHPKLYIGRRNLEGGFRQNDISHITARAVFGLKGQINDDWSYDVSYNVGKTNFSDVYLNDLSITRVERALDVIRDKDGNHACRSAINGVDPSCVPWNVFANNGNQVAENTEDGVTQAALDYLTLPLYNRGKTTMRQFSAFVVGDLTESGIVSPFASTGVNVSLGFERLEEGLELTPDNGLTSGDGAGQGGPTLGVQGNLDVDELFAEAQIPILEQGEMTLVADLGVRRASYSTDKSATTSKFGLSLGVNKDISVRASFQKAIRHATIRELFDAQSLGLFDGTDPCAGSEPTATLAECERSGVTAAQYGLISKSPAGQYNATSGGNSDLLPEEAETMAIGFVYTPDYIEGLDITVDYFSIELTDGIDGIGAQTILDQCTENGTPELCNLIQRGSGGTLWLGLDTIVNTNINTGSEKRAGVDINVNYSMDMADWGNLKLSMVATKNIKFTSEAFVGAEVDDCLGLWAGPCGAPNPELNMNTRATWTSPSNDFSVSAKLRHVDAVESADDRPNFGAVSVLDLTALYSYNNLDFRLGMNNLFDRDPPIAGNPPSGNGNTYPGVYDALGRFVFFGVTANF